jgi:hypothetical protein
LFLVSRDIFSGVPQGKHVLPKFRFLDWGGLEGVVGKRSKNEKSGGGSLDRELEAEI